MKTPICFLFLFFYFSLFLISCGNTTDEGEYPLVLKLELPQSLAKSERRRERFIAMAEVLTVTIETKEGTTLQQSYSKTYWQKINLPNFAFPKSASDKAAIKVEIHAKRGNGTRIMDAALKGEGVAYAKDLKKNSQNNIEIKLSLTVQPDTWD